MDRTQAEPIRVAYDRIHRCLEEIPNELWSNNTRKHRINRQKTDSEPSSSRADLISPDDGHSLQSDKVLNKVAHCWKDCLHPRKDHTGWDT